MTMPGGGRKFTKGTSGNPSGRTKGTRNRTTIALEALLEGEAEAITRKAVEMALAGDTVALRLCMERLIPARKDRPIRFQLPEINGPKDLTRASAALLAAVAAGDITPSEAAELGRLIDAHVKAVEAADFAERLAALEARTGGA